MLSKRSAVKKMMEQGGNSIDKNPMEKILQSLPTSEAKIKIWLLMRENVIFMWVKFRDGEYRQYSIGSPHQSSEI